MPVRPRRAARTARQLLALVALVAMALPHTAFGWGFQGHRRLASHLHEPFPQGSCLRAWLSSVTGRADWQDKACDPDRWRGDDPESCNERQYAPLWCEWPRHYLNIDYANPLESYPRDWAQVEETFKQHAVANGRVPWRVEELHGQLVAELRAGNGTKALETVAFLSHYVTDAASPMHTTRNQPGSLHSRYETQMLSDQNRLNALAVAMRGHYGKLGRADPKNHTFDLILVGVPLAQEIIFEDFKNDGNMTALYDHTRDLTARRFADGVTLTASLVGTAWVEAGSPRLNGMPNGCDASFPETDLEVRGFPFAQDPPQPDAGTGGDDAGTGGEDAGNGNPWVPPSPLLPEEPPVGCGCASAQVSLVLPGVLLGLLTLRRNRSRSRGG